MSNEPPESAFSRTKIKIRFGEFRGILRRFAEFTLMPICAGCCLRDRLYVWSPSLLTHGGCFVMLYESFRFIDATHLLESETWDFSLSYPEYWTFTDETILFEKWNNIVWLAKHKCLMSQTIFFGRWNVNILELRCIVF